jgi:hypothetical protein
MRIESALFGLIGIFFFPVTAVYWILSREWVGTVGMLLSGFFGLMIAYYLGFTARRMTARPSDRPDAEIADDAGEVGFFAPHSWWPIALAFSATVLGIGLVIGPFLAIIGLFMVLGATVGLLFEYYVGINRSQGHTLGELQAMGERPTSQRKFLGE